MTWGNYDVRDIDDVPQLTQRLVSLARLKSGVVKFAIVDLLTVACIGGS